MIKKFTISRIREELKAPRLLFSKRIIYFFHYIINLFFNKKTNKKIPYLIFDVRNNPITFDFVYIVFDAYTFFFNKGIKSFNLIIFLPLNYIK